MALPSETSFSNRTRLNATTEDLHRRLVVSWLGRLRQRRSPRPMGLAEAELLGLLRLDGCPICRARAEHERNFIFWFLLENYYDPGVLDRFARALGFCARHGASLLVRHAPSPIASVHEFAARRLLALLTRDRLGRTRRRDPLAAAIHPEACPACESSASDVSRTASFLAKMLDNEPIFDDSGRPGILCFSHMQQVAPTLADATLERLMARHDAAFGRALQSLDGIADEGRAGATEPALRLVVGHNPVSSRIELPLVADPGAGVPDPVTRLADTLGQSDACPICLEVRRAHVEWMTWLKDAAARGHPINDLLPTCAEHAWAAARIGNGSLAMKVARNVLRGARLALDQAAEVLAVSSPPRAGILARLAHARESYRRHDRAREVLCRPLHCPVCSRRAEAEARALQLLVALLGQARYRAAFDQGYGLCAKHFARALALAPGPAARDALVEVEAAKLDCLAWELQEYLRKRAWAARPEAPGAEQNAPARAVVRFSGLGVA